MPRGDVRVGLLRRHAPGKTVADLGCLWDVHGRFAFLAEEFGAAGVTAVDVYPASAEFLAEKEKRASAVNFVQGDVTRPETLAAIGAHDVVFCSGVLYHHPSPFHLLQQIRTICRETLLLGTKTVPEISGLANTAVFYPYLPERQRRLWALGRGRQRAITGPYEAESGYGNWFWGLSPSCVASLFTCAGFEVLDSTTRGFDSWFVCAPSGTRFAEVSGAWSSSTDPDFRGAIDAP